MLSFSLRTQVHKGIRSSEFRQRTKIGDPVYAKKSEIRWHVMRYSAERWLRAVIDRMARGVKRTPGWPPASWSNHFTKPLNERSAMTRASQASTNQWTTLARDMKNGAVTGARSRTSMINGTTGDTGDVILLK
uniref:Transposase n=1 Tax=Haemonchus contortus TaxID=6289 RepID=A0A7I4Z4W1_HAECO